MRRTGRAYSGDVEASLAEPRYFISGLLVRTRSAQLLHHLDERAVFVPERWVVALLLDQEGGNAGLRRRRDWPERVRRPRTSVADGWGGGLLPFAGFEGA